MSKTCFDIDLANVRPLEYTDRNKDVLERQPITRLSLIQSLVIITLKNKGNKEAWNYSYKKYRKTWNIEGFGLFYENISLKTMI